MFLLIIFTPFKYNSDEKIQGNLGEQDSEIRNLTFVNPTATDQVSKQQQPVLSESFESKQSRRKQQNTKGQESKNQINIYNSLKNDEINLNKLLKQLINRKNKDKKQKKEINRHKIKNETVKRIDFDQFFPKINNDKQEKDTLTPSEETVSNQAENETFIDELHEYQSQNKVTDEELKNSTDQTNSDDQEYIQKIIQPNHDEIIDNEINQVLLIPHGFEHDVRTVVCSSNATAIINYDGELKFNQPFNPDSVKIFENYQSGKLSLSSRFLCAINDTKELSCQRVTSTKSKLKKLQIPSILVEDTIEVSAGLHQICAISKNHSAICWAQHDKGGKMMYVPKHLREPDQAKQISTMHKKHCGIDISNKLICWGKYGGRQFKEEFDDPGVTAVSWGRSTSAGLGRRASWSAWTHWQRHGLACRATSSLARSM